MSTKLGVTENFVSSLYVLLLLLLLLFLLLLIIISVSFYVFDSAFPSVWLIITRDRPDNLYLAMLFPLKSLLTLLYFYQDQHSSQILWTVAFQFFKIWLRTYHSDILVSTVKVLHFTKTDFNWVLCYVFNPNESSIILFTSPQVLWRRKDYWRLGKLALKKKQ